LIPGRAAGTANSGGYAAGGYAAARSSWVQHAARRRAEKASYVSLRARRERLKYRIKERQATTSPGVITRDIILRARGVSYMINIQPMATAALLDRSLCGCM
jgi:hypothetical protein